MDILVSQPAFGLAQKRNFLPPVVLHSYHPNALGTLPGMSAEQAVQERVLLHLPPRAPGARLGAAGEREPCTPSTGL